MAPITATWHKLAEAEILQRSSQVLSVADQKAFIFGGELLPREPRDNNLHVVDVAQARDDSINTLQATPNAPSPRVGSTSTTLNGKIYLFSGRGGVAMAPIDEEGSLWKFDPSTSAWSRVEPNPMSPCPAARSYHSMTNDGDDKIYVHAGCPENGRLSDLWHFSVSHRTWVELAPAPEPPRGGTSITFSGGLLYRMNGFDGKTEQGGSLDIYSPKTNTWSTVPFQPDGVSGPPPRSVSALLALTIGGKPSLVTLCGERDPSALGHQGAGKMRNDVWVYDIESQKWTEVEINGDTKPAPRGWFAADVKNGEPSRDTIVVQGGLGEENNRLGDVWALEF